MSKKLGYGVAWIIVLCLTSCVIAATVKFIGWILFEV